MPTAKVLVVAGGGSGRTGSPGYGGGGAGGTVRYNAAYVLTSGNKTVTVGATSANNGNGNDSVFDTITATGGGAGIISTHVGGSNADYSGGAANGTNAGGGAGAGGNGTNGGVDGGNGGAGYNASTAFGTGIGVSGLFSGGGGGGPYGDVPNDAGGGNSCQGGDNPQAGATNTGGGGGGGGSSGTPTGGSGLVAIRYKTINFGLCTGGTKSVIGDETMHIFTSSGTFICVLLPLLGFFHWFFSEAWRKHDKLWTPDKPDKRLILPKDLGFSY